MSDVIWVGPLRVFHGTPHPQTDDDLAQRHLVNAAYDKPDRLVCLVRTDDGTDVCEWRGYAVEYRADLVTLDGPVWYRNRDLPGPTIARGADLGDGWEDFVRGLVG